MEALRVTPCDSTTGDDAERVQKGVSLRCFSNMNRGDLPPVPDCFARATMPNISLTTGSRILARLRKCQVRPELVRLSTFASFFCASQARRKGAGVRRR